MMPWKAAIDDYIERLNRAEFECTGALLRECIADEAYLLLMEDKLRRHKESGAMRGLTMLKQETRLSIKRVAKTEDGIRTELMLRKKFVYEQKDRRFLEERLEREHLFLRKDSGEWKIVEVRPDLSERGVPVRQASGGTQGRASEGGVRGGGLHGSGFRGNGLHGSGMTGRSSHGNIARGPEATGAGSAMQPIPAIVPGPYLHPSVRAARPLVRTKRYMRREAAEYADRWWDTPNPEYKAFAVDCTNYVSQCLFAGGAPMTYTGKRNSGWWYRHGGGDDWSFSWSVSNSLYWYLAGSKSGLTAQRVQSPKELEPGDVILYDWDGDGHFQHSTIVTGKDANGYPLVNAHTVNSRRRYWDYRDSHAWSEQTRYRFFHVSDVFA